MPCKILKKCPKVSLLSWTLIFYEKVFTIQFSAQPWRTCNPISLLAAFSMFSSIRISFTLHDYLHENDYCSVNHQSQNDNSISVFFEPCKYVTAFLSPDFFPIIFFRGLQLSLLISLKLAAQMSTKAARQTPCLEKQLDTALLAQYICTKALQIGREVLPSSANRLDDNKETYFTEMLFLPFRAWGELSTFLKSGKFPRELLSFYVRHNNSLLGTW